MDILVKKYTGTKGQTEEFTIDADIAYYGLAKTYFFKYATYVRLKNEIKRALHNYKYIDKSIDYLNYYVFKKFGLYAVLVHLLDYRTSYYEIITIDQYKKHHLKVTYDVDMYLEEDTNETTELIKSLQNERGE